QLKARKSINQQLQRKGGPGEAVMFLNIGNSMESFFMDLKCDGLYRSWPFLTTKLVVDKSTIPLAEFAISHLMALEERVEKIAKDFKYRSSQFTPPAQMSYIREFPDTPQVISEKDNWLELLEEPREELKDLQKELDVGTDKNCLDINGATEPISVIWSNWS
ncbi:7429_t:CDS:2, partial [Cetraspora pellucida]